MIRESGPRSPEQREVSREFEEIAFESYTEKNGSTTWRSSGNITSEPGEPIPEGHRKMIKLKPGGLIVPEADIIYDVKVVEDTKPDNPRKGILWVEITGESGVPMDEAGVPQETREKETQSPFFVDREGGWLYILDTRIKLGPERRTALVPSLDKFRYFAMDQRTLEIIHKVAKAWANREPILLQGDTATTKTSAYEYLCALAGYELESMNMNGSTNTSELIGKYVPNDGQLQISFEMALRSPNLKADSREIIERAQTDGRALTMLESEQVARNEGLKIPEWRWQDGMDIRAKREGRVLVLDEMNLAEGQVLERLNAQVDTNPQMTLSEKGGIKMMLLTEEEQGLYESGQLPGVEPIHPGFRIAAAVNPPELGSRNILSTAFRRRWLAKKEVPNPTRTEFEAMVNLMVFGKHPVLTIDRVKYQAPEVEPKYDNLKEKPWMRAFIQKIVRFHSAMEQMARDRTIGRSRKEPYVFTRTKLIQLIDRIATTEVFDRRYKPPRRKDFAKAPREIIQREIAHCYLDEIANPDDLNLVNDKLAMYMLNEDKWPSGGEEYWTTKWGVSNSD